MNLKQKKFFQVIKNRKEHRYNNLFHTNKNDKKVFEGIIFTHIF